MSKFTFFWIPARFGEKEAEALNAFLTGQSVVTVHTHFVPDGTQSGWALSVEWLNQKVEPLPRAPRAKIDYREILSPEDFAIFARLREWRKSAATEEGVPAYAILTNEQLAQVAEQKPSTMDALTKVSGLGKSRIQKYGSKIVATLNEETAMKKASESRMEEEKE